MKEKGRKSLQEVDFFRHEIDNCKSIEEKLQKELFNVRISNSSKLNEQEENILDLERHIRNNFITLQTL